MVRISHLHWVDWVLKQWYKGEPNSSMPSVHPSSDTDTDTNVYFAVECSVSLYSSWYSLRSSYGIPANMKIVRIEIVKVFMENPLADNI